MPKGQDHHQVAHGSTVSGKEVRKSIVRARAGSTIEDEEKVNFDQGLASDDEFNLEGISPEELQLWSKLAPEGQKLEDIRSSLTRRRDRSGAIKRMSLCNH